MNAGLKTTAAAAEFVEKITADAIAKAFDLPIRPTGDKPMASASPTDCIRVPSTT